MFTQKHWTEKEINLLRANWGTVSVSEMSEKLNRSFTAIENKAKRIGLGGHKRGTKSANRIARETGYRSEVITRVIKNLNLSVYRVDRGATKCRHFCITFEDEQKIVQYLKEHSNHTRIYCNSSKSSNAALWGTGGKPPACISCQNIDHPHYAEGRCKLCYSKYRNKKKKNGKVKKDLDAGRD